MTPVLTDRQRQAREQFDLDAFMASLPKDPPSEVPTTKRGCAGIRLQPHHTAEISDPLLREFAAEVLGAQRCSAGYLQTLRVVLGNQAEADRSGYLLEMNRRVTFAPPNVMRSIIDQMREAGITFGKTVGLGTGRRQEVQCYRGLCAKRGDPREAAVTLERMDREQEDRDDAARDRALPSDWRPVGIDWPASEIPY